MCTGLVQRAKVTGAGKAADGWFKLDEVSVMYDCTYHTSMPQGVNIDFFNEKEGPGARVAVELSPSSAMELVHAIMESLYSAGIDPGETALGLVPPSPVVHQAAAPTPATVGQSSSSSSSSTFFCSSSSYSPEERKRRSGELETS